MTLRQIRKEKGLTLEQVAKDLKISLYSISNYELGKTKISKEMEAKFCDYYQVDRFDTIYVKQELKELQEQVNVLAKVLKYSIYVGWTKYSKVVSIDQLTKELTEKEYFILHKFIEENDLKPIRFRMEER